MKSKQKAVFIDRDDTIIVDSGYLSSPENVRLLPFAARGLAKIRDLGYLIILVTNQSGIARGYYTKKDFDSVQKKLKEMLKNENAGFDAVYYCPHLLTGTVEPFNKKCECRKPRPGMLLRASDEINLDLSKSFMVGNAESDIGAGYNAGCKTILIADQDLSMSTPPDYVATNLLEAANIIDKSDLGDS